MASDSKNCEKTHVFASSLSRNNTKLQPKWATACATHTHTHTIQISRVMNVPAVVRKLARIHAVLMSSHQINCYLCGVCAFARVVVCFDYFMRYEYDDSNWKPQDVRRFLAVQHSIVAAVVASRCDAVWNDANKENMKDALNEKHHLWQTRKVSAQNSCNRYLTDRCLSSVCVCRELLGNEVFCANTLCITSW